MSHMDSFSTSHRVQIFRRDAVSLTPPGEELAKRVADIMTRFDADFRAAVDAARTANRTIHKEFTIGHCGCISTLFRHEIRNGLRLEIPSLRLRFRIVSVSEMPETLASGGIQLASAISPPSSGDLEQIRLACDRFVAVASATSSWSLRGRLTLAELNKKPLISQEHRRTHPFLHQWLLRQCSERGLRPLEEAASVQEALDLVEHGIGIALLPTSVCPATEHTRVAEIQDLNSTEIVLLRHRNSSGSTQRIASLVAEMLTSAKSLVRFRKCVTANLRKRSLNTRAFPLLTEP
jgi:DNA-binding transcriptional LysR family regulator